MIHKTTLVILMMVSLLSSAHANTRYISDDLFTYMHVGPGTQFRMIGRVNAGDKVSFLEVNKKAGFTKIKDSRGHTGWVVSKYITRTPGVKQRLEKLETKLSQQDTELKIAKDDIKSYTSQVNVLKKKNTALSEEVKQLKLLNATLNEKVDNEKNELLMRWFTYGGMVGGIGLLLGLILPSMMPNSRKRSRW